VGDPLKGWTRKHTALADTFSIQDAAVACTGLGLRFVQVGQAGVAAQVAGGVTDGLDPHRPAVFEVLLDPRVLVEDVDDHALVVAAVDGGPEGAPGVAADLAAEDDLHVGGPAEVEVVGDERFEEAAGVAGCVEHDGAGDLDLAHRALPPVAGVPIRLAQRQRQAGQPALDEDVDRAGPEPVADRLEHGGVGAGGEPVGQLAEGQPGLGGLAFGPSCPLTQILIG